MQRMLVASVLVLAMASACSTDSRADLEDITDEQVGDDNTTTASESDRITLKAQQTVVYLQPDGFPNVATVCIEGGHRVVSTTRSAGVNLVVVINDHTCPGSDPTAPSSSSVGVPADELPTDEEG